MRANGVIVDDVPMHLSPEGQSTHSIYIPDEDIRLPLKLHGCVTYLPTCFPTQEEIENKMWLILTNKKTEHQDLKRMKISFTSTRTRYLWLAKWQRLCCINSSVIHIKFTHPRGVLQDPSSYHQDFYDLSMPKYCFQGVLSQKMGNWNSDCCSDCCSDLTGHNSERHMQCSSPIPQKFQDQASAAQVCSFGHPAWTF